MDVKQGGEYDVAVVGGGPAGIMAAISAARAGAKTLLVERNGYLGGELATGLPILVFYDQAGRLIMRGLPDEFVSNLQELGGSPGHIFGRKDLAGHGHTSCMTPVYPEVVKVVSAKMFLDSGGTLMLDTDLADVECEGDKVKSIVVHDADGLHRIGVKNVVDCTGNGDVIGQSGASFKKGREKDGKVQSMTLLFYMGNVDVEEAAKHFTEEWYWGVRPGEKEEQLMHMGGSLETWQRMAPEEFPFSNCEGHKLWAMVLRPGLLSINLSDIANLDPTSSADMTRAEIAVREQVLQLSSFLVKHVPGFSSSYLLGTPARIGAREGRRLDGLYELQPEDILEAQEFEDSIGLGGYCMDMHDPDGKGITFSFIKDGGHYQMPYRSLVHRKVDGLLAAGRCISATHQALAAVRVMGICMVTGEAAGTAAALAAARGVEARDLDVGVLQDTLRQNRVLLD